MNSADTSEVYAHPIKHQLQHLLDKEKAHLAGNTMHATAMSLVLIVALSGSRRKRGFECELVRG